MRSSFDSALFRRSTVRFDRLFDLLENASGLDPVDPYLPFDLERVGEERYRITMTVAGFSHDELDLQVKEGVLTVSGRKSEENDRQHEYLHRGITSRTFERRFQLADFVQVRGADLEDGLLRIELQREVPEAMKPRRIEIGGNVHRFDNQDGDRQQIRQSESSRHAA